MPDGKSYELVGGQLVERNMGAESSWIGGRLLLRLGRFCEDHEVGWPFPADNGYQCFAHAPGLVRKPDVSLIRYSRLPGKTLPKGWIKVPPDLAVEVVSPNDTVYNLEDKLEDYQKAGVPLVWVIYPNSRTVRVHRGDRSIIYLHEDDQLSGEDVIPGFLCPLREIFPPLEPFPQVLPAPTAPNGPQASASA